jgi:hypothetical protein
VTQSLSIADVWARGAAVPLSHQGRYVFQDKIEGIIKERK